MLTGETSTVGAGIARTVWLRRLSTQFPRDITWVAFDTFAWTLLEMNLALVCASAPALKVFFGAYVVAPITKRSNTQYATSGGLSNRYEMDASFLSSRGGGQSMAAAGKSNETVPSPYKNGFGNDIMVSTRVSVSHDSSNGPPPKSFFHY